MWRVSTRTFAPFLASGLETNVSLSLSDTAGHWGVYRTCGRLRVHAYPAHRTRAAAKAFRRCDSVCLAGAFVFDAQEVKMEEEGWRILLIVAIVLFVLCILAAAIFTVLKRSKEVRAGMVLVP